jgi:hypothetical protein
MAALNALAPNTVSSYRRSMRMVCAELGVSTPTALIVALNEVDEAYGAIKARWPNPVTRAKILTAVLAYVKRERPANLAKKALSAWKHIHFVLRRNSARRTGKLSEREKTAWVSFKEIANMRRRLEHHEEGSMRHLFLSWYTLWPPTRADHYNTMIFQREADVPAELRAWMYFRPPHVDNGTVREKAPASAVPHGGARTVIVSTRSDNMPRQNFIVLEPSTPREWSGSGPKPEFIDQWDRAPRMVILDHKSANTHGRILRALPPPLAAVLHKSLQQQPRSTLFLSNRGNEFRSPHSFTVWGERTLATLFGGRRLGFNGLRHSYISNVNFTASSPQQLMTLARDMAHSTYMQQLYRRGNFKEGRDPVLKEK